MSDYFGTRARPVQKELAITFFGNERVKQNRLQRGFLVRGMDHYLAFFAHAHTFCAYSIHIL